MVDYNMDWVNGFNTTIAIWVLENTVTYNPDYTSILSPIGEHIIGEGNCGFASIRIDEENERELSNPWDSESGENVTYITAKMTCKCGKYVNEYMRKGSSTITEVIHSIISAQEYESNK
jgi:hypothetical protein